MNSNYQSYLNYLASFADSHSLAVQTETSIYPLFVDIKGLISHYRSTIEKFANVQSEIISFVQQLEFEENDFDYYQEKFIELRKVDEYLQELKTKKLSTSISNEVITFISNTYSSASLYTINKMEEKVLSYHNKVAETARQDEQQASTTKTIIIVVVVVLFLIFLISKCNH